MRSRLLVCLASFVMLAALLLSFNVAYKRLIYFSALQNRVADVKACFANLNAELTNAAIINPVLSSQKGYGQNSLFYADSASVANNLNRLKNTVRDSVNIGLVKQLDSLITIELPWLLASNVPDSVAVHRSPGRIATLQHMYTLTDKGIARTDYLLQSHKASLMQAFTWVKTAMFVFGAFSVALLLFTTLGFLKQLNKSIVKEKELEKSELRFSNMLESMMEGVQIIDKNWRYIYVNPAASKQGYYPVEEMIGASIPDLYPGVENSELFATLKICMLHRSVHRIETDFSFPNGTVSTFELYIQPIPEGIFILSVDISERKKAETELQKNIEELKAYKFALDESCIVAITDQKGTIKHVNQNFCNISKYTESELIGNDHRLISSGYHPAAFIRNLWATIAGGKIWRGELKNKAKDGSYYWVDTTIVPFLNQAGKPYQYLAIRSDITHRVNKQEELAKVNRLYSFISAINQSIVHISNEEQLLRKACSIAIETGQFKVAWLAMAAADGTLKVADIQGGEEIVKDVLAHLEYGFANADINHAVVAPLFAGGAYWVSNNAQQDPVLAVFRTHLQEHNIQSGMILPVKKFGKVVGLFAFGSCVSNFFDAQEIDLLKEAAGDISFALEVIDKEQKRTLAEKELVQSEERFKKAQHIAHIGHWQLNLATGMAVWSDEACLIYGLKPTENKHSYDTWKSFIHPEDLTHVKRKIEEAYRTLKPSAFDHRIIRHNGSIRHIHVESQFEFDADGKPCGLYGINHDVTEQKLFAQQLMHSESKLNEAQHIARVGSFEMDIVNNRYAWSDELYQLFGMAKAPASQELFLSFIHPDDTDMFVKQMGDAYDNQQNASHNFRFVTKNGETKYGYTEWKFEFDKHRKPLRLYGILQDVTEKKIAQDALLDANNKLLQQVDEIKSLNENLEARVIERTTELKEANRELEAFSYTVSHDLQSPLRSLRGFSTLLLRNNTEELSQDTKEMLGIIDNSAKRMSSLISDLLAFSKLGKAPMQKWPTDMNELVATVVDEIKFNTLPAGTAIIQNDLQPGLCDAALIKQVWVNLIGNAVKYSSKKEKPCIEIGMTENETGPVYYVKDNGAGFDMKYADKLFGVFQRMHKQQDFDGTGVGLATVQRIVARHGGKVWAQSAVNEGAVFYFTLGTT